MIQTGDPKGRRYGGKSIWKGKDKSKDSGTGLRMSILHTFTTFVEPLPWPILVQIPMVVNSISTKIRMIFQVNSQLTASQLRSSMLIKNGGNPTLDGGNYTVFGQVIDGMDVVDKIASAETDDKDKPKADIKIEKSRS